MPSFSFKCPAVETQQGTAYFTVEAETVEEARVLLAADSSVYFDEFCEETGGVEWEINEPDDWEEI